MGAPHGHTLHFHGHSPVHRLPAHLKILSLLAFVLTVVATPGAAYWAFAVYLGLLVALIRVSKVPFRYILPRMVVEIPFVIFALILPFVAIGPQVAIGPFQVSEAGLLAAWTLLAKATLGVMGALVLATTTDANEVVAGLERLRLPATMVQILSFMLRYLEVVAQELHRMKIARISRGFQGKGLRTWPVLAKTVGSLFIRSYERGERVHLAMLSRGYTGTMPHRAQAEVRATQVGQAVLLPGLAMAVLLSVNVSGWWR